MGRYDNTRRNQYNSTPRKVFDSYIDRMAVKRQRDREDHRNDLQVVFQKMKELENQLTLVVQELDELQEHIERHCLQLDSHRDPRDS